MCLFAKLGMNGLNIGQSIIRMTLQLIILSVGCISVLGVISVDACLVGPRKPYVICISISIKNHLLLSLFITLSGAEGVAKVAADGAQRAHPELR